MNRPYNFDPQPFFPLALIPGTRFFPFLTSF